MPLCAALVRCSCAVVHLCDAPIQCVQLLFFSSLPLSSTNTLPSAIPLCNLFLWCPSGALAQWAFAVAFCDSLNCTCAMLLCNALVQCLHHGGAFVQQLHCFDGRKTTSYKLDCLISTLQIVLMNLHCGSCLRRFNCLFSVPEGCPEPDCQLLTNILLQHISF